MLKSIKSKGGIQIYIFFYFLLGVTLMILLYFVARYYVNAEIQILKDGSDFANLAVYKDVNREVLGSTGDIVFLDSDTLNVYNTFKTYLSDNLKLDNSLSPINDGFIKDVVTINDIRIYSVNNGLTTEYAFDSDINNFLKIKDSVSGIVFTPNNKKVESTSIYSKITVKVQIFFEMYGVVDIPIVSYTDAINIF